MDETKMRQQLEEMEIPEDKIDEVIHWMKHPEQADKVLRDAGYSVDHLREQLLLEDDWVSRARIAARIISNDLE